MKPLLGSGEVGGERLEDHAGSGAVELAATSPGSMLDDSSEAEDSELEALIREVAALPRPPGDSGSQPPTSPRKTRRSGNNFDELQEGTIVAQRYRVVGLLGRGGMSSVYEADDGVERVALKVVRNASAEKRARFRREVAALRRLAAPGLVRLRDEGEEGACTYLVMDIVPGAPFPGCEKPASWEALAGPTLELLAVLGRVHNRGIIHRDLKPANVLIDAHGTVTILDFGLAADESGRMDRLTTEGQLLGTPGYMAPEQLQGAQLTPVTDLYALGVMLYEALAGERPHAQGAAGRQLYARMHQDAPRLALAGVPDAVVECVAALLARDPRRRPQNAAAAAAMLRGETSPVAKLPRLGDATLVHRVAGLLQQGTSVDLVGGSGAGKTRLLADVKDALREQGANVYATSRGDLPYAAVAGFFDASVLSASEHGTDVARRLEEAVRRHCAPGCVLMVDDADAIDLASRSLIARLVGQVPVLRALEVVPQRSRATAVALSLLSPADLTAMFTGPERLFHLPSDAARLLHQRTRGMPGRVTHELQEWITNGICRVEAGRVSIERDAIERLEAGLVRFDRTLPRATSALKPNLEALMGWIVVAGADVSTELLAAATEMPLWRVEAEVDELVEAGFVRVHAAHVEPLRSSPGDLDTLERARRHRRLATVAPAHTAAMVTHTFAAGYETDAELRDATHAMVAHAERLARRGRLAAATAILSEHLRTIEPARPQARELVEQVLVMWVRVALCDVSATALDRVLYEICRAEATIVRVHHLEALVRAALSLDQWGERIATRVESLPSLDDPALERLRQAVRVAGARRTSRAREELLLEELRSWAEATPHAESRAAFDGWLGRLRYRQERFREAAELHRACARGCTWATDRALAQLNAASALLEEHDYDAAAAWAKRARRLGARSRHAFLEARAEWILRRCGFRSGAISAPDAEFLEVVQALGVRTLTTMVALTEAAIAFRQGALHAARRLAAIARDNGHLSGEPLGSILAAALAVACGEILSPAELDRCLAQAEACPADLISAQALALLCRGGVTVPQGVREAAVARLGDPSDPRLRDVLSPRECAVALRG